MNDAGSNDATVDASSAFATFQINEVAPNVAFYRSGTTSPATFFDRVEALQDAGQWSPSNCAGNPCNTNALAQGISFNWARRHESLT